jgi:uncharacterized protein YxjI
MTKKWFIFRDEFEVHLKREEDLMAELKKQTDRRSISCQQSSETWHDNFDFEDSNREIEMISKRLSKMQDFL